MWMSHHQVEVETKRRLISVDLNVPFKARLLFLESKAKELKIYPDLIKFLECKLFFPVQSQTWQYEGIDSLFVCFLT